MLRKTFLRSISGVSAHILAIQPKQVKRIKEWLTRAREQVIEDGSVLVIETDNLAVDDCVLHLQAVCDCVREIRETEWIAIARDKLALAVFDEGESTEAVEFYLEDEIVTAERTA